MFRRPDEGHGKPMNAGSLGFYAEPTICLAVEIFLRLRLYLIINYYNYWGHDIYFVAKLNHIVPGQVNIVTKRKDKGYCSHFTQ